jgi:hypothetical protein
MPDVLQGLAHLIKHSNFQLPSLRGTGGSTSTPTGKPFEIYCKDWLSLLPPNNIIQRQSFYNSAFAYQGSDNNPPDVMFKGGNSGDAFEFKKTESQSGSLLLNSSFPKNLLHINSPGLLDSCINCEQWTQRNFYYIVGRIKPGNERISFLWLVDGELMATDHNVYETIFLNLRGSVNTFISSNNLKSITSKELGRFRGIDPNDKTVLRARSMWELESPQKTFKNLPGVEMDNSKSVLHALILENKWNSYPLQSQNEITSLIGLKGFDFSTIKNIPDPRNPNNLLTGKLVRFAL